MFARSSSELVSALWLKLLRPDRCTGYMKAKPSAPVSATRKMLSRVSFKGAMTDESRITRKRPQLPEIDEVTESSIDSFPASDPPAWSSMRVGPPRSLSKRAKRPDSTDTDG